MFRKSSSDESSEPRCYHVEEETQYTNIEITVALKKYHNIDVGSVRQLNQILCEMGIVEKCDDRWLLTEYGRVNFTPSGFCCFNPNYWEKHIVDAVADYIR